LPFYSINFNYIGTIGMKRIENGGYAPVKDWLGRQISVLAQFHDPMFEDIEQINELNRPFVEPPRNSQPVWFISPKSPENVRALYHLLEFDPLLDSSNMSSSDWCRIGKVIADNYESFDAFIILHGTDTMAYTASALSFMLENLSKTVVMTGSQIPISQTRNDGFDNLLGALIIAMHYEIPEVCLFFNNKLFRGNRASKINSSSLNAFGSGNMAPLVTMGIDIDVNWALIRKPSQLAFRLRKIKADLNVACLKLFPGMTDDVLRAFLRPPMKGCILLTYGAGNAPDNRKEFLQILKEACDSGIVIVNCTQCVQGMVTGDYASGLALYQAGVVPGRDMTGEAALAKLMYLLSNEDLTLSEVRRLMSIDLRGELTVKRRRPRFSLKDTSFIHSVARALTEKPMSDKNIMDDIRAALLPIVLCSLASTGDISEIKRMHEMEGIDLNVCDYDGRYALHLAACEGKFDLVKYLVENGAEVNVKDRWGHTPYSEALRFGFTEIADYLLQHGAKVD
jgi:lysophospholipase